MRLGVGCLGMGMPCKCSFIAKNRTVVIQIAADVIRKGKRNSCGRHFRIIQPPDEQLDVSLHLMSCHFREGNFRFDSGGFINT
jgi:hypothetical protein